MLRIVAHYNFFPLFTIYICPWIQHSLLRQLLYRPLFCVWLYAYCSHLHTINNLRFPPSDATVYAFCLQLIMQPQGKWVQRLDKTNTGVTVVARRVSRKLSVSKEGLWNPTTCWTIMWICKGKELQTYTRIKFSTLLSLSPKHAAPPSFSRLPSCLRAENSLGAGPLGSLGMKSGDIDHRVISTPGCLVCAPCHVRSLSGRTITMLGTLPGI